MDPVTLKLIQLLIVTIIGATGMVFGFILFLRGLSGKSTIIMSGHGFKGKITNASPGVFLLIVGALAIYWSVSKDITKQEKSKDTVVETSGSIDEWLANASKISPETGYTDMITQLIPKGDFQAKNFVLHRDRSLAQLADSVYKDSKYWKLIAIINKDRGYYDYSTATGQTTISKDKLIEYFAPSKFEHVRDRETLIKVRAKDMQVVYDLMSHYTDTAKHVQDLGSLSTLEKRIKDQYELSLVYKFETADGTTTVNELAMKYYSDKKYAALILGFNPNLPKKLDPASPIAKATPLFIPYLL